MQYHDINREPNIKISWTKDQTIEKCSQNIEKSLKIETSAK